jgi:ATP-dependent Zn protease
MALNNSRLINQPEPLRTAYKRFLIAYTFQLLSLNVHKQLIKKIADELLKKKTLSYEQVQEIVDQYVRTE